MDDEVKNVCPVNDQYCDDPKSIALIINYPEKNIILPICFDCPFAPKEGQEISDEFKEFIKGLNVEVSCSGCNMKLSDFLKIKKIGCSKCYEAFAGSISILLENCHDGNSKHCGKVPKNKQFELVRLEEELKKLVKNEKYEDAAIVRDKIKKLTAI